MVLCNALYLILLQHQSNKKQKPATNNDIMPGGGTAGRRAGWWRSWKKGRVVTQLEEGPRDGTVSQAAVI